MLIDEGNALEDQGRTAEAMARYEAAVRADPRCARAHLNRGNVLLASGDLDEARAAYERAIACDPQYAAAHFNLGNLNCRAGAYRRSLLNYQAAIAVKPDFANALVAMGNALDSLGRTAEAKASYERALAINPGDPGAHFNLGVLASNEGRAEAAAVSLRKVIAAWPDYAPAHRALGSVLSSLGQLDAAEASLRRALSIIPESEEVLFDLAMVLLAGSKSPEAVQLTLRRLESAPARTIKVAFARCVARTKFLVDDSRVRAALTDAITEPWTIPYQLCWPALSLILLDAKIAACVRCANEQWPARVPRAALFGTEGLAALSADSLLLALLATAAAGTLEFEHFLTAARYVLLETVNSHPSPDPADTQALPFYAALARQCFITEYIFDCDDREAALAAACRAKLVALLDTNATIPPLLLLSVATYFPLYTLPEPGRLLLPANEQGPVEDVLRQQVREPLEEQALRPGIASLTPITHGVSERVREQYEQNPYPRWVRLPMHEPVLRFNTELRRTFPLARFTPLANDVQPEMLIAGCGTGSQPILATRRFLGVRVLAIDLSLNSISYALRKTRESGVTNVEFAQADILKLGNVSRTFDVVAAVGVLHHLGDPFAGWRTLLSRLRPGGFMQLGFYSQLARRHVAKAREIIAARGYASTVDGIRCFRRDFTRDMGVELQWLSQLPDFYSTSECRDLVFHVQEHCLTLGQIESFLSESGLHFIGFELDLRVLQQYRTRFSDDPGGTNLRSWAQFESDNPDTFAGMYQFWVQKPA
ncbi:MAG TPA: tetratricopeptide repeat protein [Steroidobacteraceae bacterium]|nr:tetratricopeptide repeat protein [Steroidobacteraceae bacterium]